MDPTMDSTKHILNYLMPILEEVDIELHDFMIRFMSFHQFSGFAKYCERFQDCMSKCLRVNLKEINCRFHMMSLFMSLYFSVSLTYKTKTFMYNKLILFTVVQVNLLLLFVKNIDGKEEEKNNWILKSGSY